MEAKMFNIYQQIFDSNIQEPQKQYSLKELFEMENNGLNNKIFQMKCKQ